MILDAHTLRMPAAICYQRAVELDTLAGAIAHLWHFDGDITQSSLYCSLRQVAVSHHSLLAVSLQATVLVQSLSDLALANSCCAPCFKTSLRPSTTGELS